jgi:glutaredoxin domain-containing cysteine-rich protein 1
MKGMRGKLFRKLKFIPSFSTFKQGLVLQPDPSEKLSNQNCQTPPVYKEQDQKSNSLSELIFGSSGSSEHDKHPKDEELELDNFTSSMKYPKEKVAAKESPEVIIMEHCSTHDEAKDSEEHPSLSDFEHDKHPKDEELELDNFTSSIKYPKDKVAAKESPEVIIMEHCSTHEAKDSEEHPSLSDFEENCPPGGSESIMFYTTSLRGIRKTFEDCNTIRFLLESFKVLFYERDVSMHLEYREELWRILGDRVIPPRLFIKGRYIGGANEVAGLHEQGKLRKLLEGIPLDLSSSCSGCANARFVVCLNCSGSRKIVADGENSELYIRCPECNENGLVQCPICC